VEDDWCSGGNCNDCGSEDNTSCNKCD
jgi:hypothetical protein